MGFLDRFRSALAPWDGTHGPPPSGNGASSFHLGWSAPAGEWVRAEATLEVVEPPTAPTLHFWALQVSFADRGRQGGAGHIGLQWHPDFPGGAAVNWGGYGADGQELRGSVSALPSRVGNVNTRDYPWVPGRPYRLEVSLADEPGPGGRSAWRGAVTDLATGETTVVRDLWAVGTTLHDPIVWSEVFADCDDPPSAVRWRDLRLHAGDGSSVAADRLSVNYQSLSDGGCANTNSVVDGDGWRQTTNTARHTRQGSILRLDDGP